MAFSFSPKIVTNGLVLYLDAANTRSYPRSGNTWFDLSGNNNHGTLTNGPTFNNGNNGSIVFDGVNDYVDLGSTNFSISRDFSICFWTNITKNLGNQIFNKGYNSPWGIYIDKQPTNNKLSCQVSLTSGFIQLDTITSDYSGLKYWVVNRNNTQMAWYVNSLLDNSSTVSNLNVNQSVSKSWRIGSNSEAILNTLGGRVFQFKIYNRALSQQEILQNYNATKGRYGL